MWKCEKCGAHNEDDMPLCRMCRAKPPQAVRAHVEKVSAKSSAQRAKSAQRAQFHAAHARMHRPWLMLIAALAGFAWFACITYGALAVVFSWGQAVSWVSSYSAVATIRNTTAALSGRATASLWPVLSIFLPHLLAMLAGILFNIIAFLRKNRFFAVLSVAAYIVAIIAMPAYFGGVLAPLALSIISTLRLWRALSKLSSH